MPWMFLKYFGFVLKISRLRRNVADMNGVLLLRAITRGRIQDFRKGFWNPTATTQTICWQSR